MKVLHNPHWAAYLAASGAAHGPRRFGTGKSTGTRCRVAQRKKAGRVASAARLAVPRCRTCEAIFYGFAGCTAVVIGWLLLFGWQ